MSNETIVILANAADDSLPNTWQYSQKVIGAGYYKNGAGLHTVIFEFDNFVGAVKIQATLASAPDNTDWFDVIYDSSDTVLTALDSTPLINNAACTFTGKFVYIRAAFQLEQGTIKEIRYNY